MGGNHFTQELGLVLLAALVGGLVARALKLPLLVGYLVAGVAVGPHTPGLVANEEAVHSVATFGVALLMFTVGAHLSLRELLAAKRIALIGGGLAILGTIGLGVILGLALGWGSYGGVFLGCALALSSTAVMMRILEERGELGSAHGTAMMAVLVMQDLAVVAMVALLPSLAATSSQGPSALLGVFWSLLKAGVLVGLTLVLALRGVPALLERVARMGSRELFLLVIVSICLLAGYLAQRAGLSLELGAFLAGLVISESDYAHEVSNQMRPLRDLFASVFFVSVGMLLDPRFLATHWLPVLAVVLAILVGKALITALAVFASGVHGRTAVLTGLGLAQVGEFSFVLAGIGTERGLVPADLASVVLASALITILLTPFAFGAAQPVYRLLNARPALSRMLNRRPTEDAESTPQERPPVRALILGCGRVGRYVSDAFDAMNVSYRVVDYDAAAITRLRKAGVPVVYGDATSETVLAAAAPQDSELAVVALSETAMIRMAVKKLKRLAPELRVVARVHRGVDILTLHNDGADAVIYAEFEAGTEMIRQGLCRLGFSDSSISGYLDELRENRYRSDPALA